MIGVLIVDDEPLARRGLRRALAAFPNVTVVGESGNGLDAVRAIVEQAPDLVLLDVQMPGLSGFDVIERVGVDAMPAVIFVTAYDRYALRAFEVHAVDYVLKPIDPDRFRDAFDRAARLLTRERPRAVTDRLERLLKQVEAGGRGGDGAVPLDRLVVRDHDRMLFVEVDGIDWIEAAGNYVRLHVGAREYLLRSTMDRLAHRLGTDRFVRVRRSALVNVRAITSVEAYAKGSYAILLRAGGSVISSRYYGARLRSLLRVGD